MRETPNNVEGGQEIVPTSEEVQAVFERLVGEKKYAETRKLEDEKGLYLWEIEIATEEGKTEYLYMRKGRYQKGGEASTTAIHVAFYDTDGMPVGGELAAEYREGVWEFIP